MTQTSPRAIPATDAALRRLLGSLVSVAGPTELEQVLDEIGIDALIDSHGEDGQTLRSLALDIVNVIADLRRRENELSALYTTARELTGVRETEDVLEAIALRAHELIPTADATYLTVRNEDDSFEVKASIGVTDPTFKNFRTVPGSGISGRILETGEMMWTRSYGGEQHITHDTRLDKAHADDGLKSVLGVPLLIRGEVIGVLYSSNRFERPLNSAECALLTSFADHAALAIDNARLFASLDSARHRVELDMRIMQRAAHLHENLTRLILEGGTISQVGEVLARVFKATVHIVDPDSGEWATRVGHPSADEAPLTASVRQELSARIPDSLESGRSVSTHGEDGTWYYVAALSTDPSEPGALVLQSPTELDEAIVRSVERSAHIVSLLFFRQRALVEAEEHARGELFHELVTAEALNEQLLMLVRARGIDPEEQHVCVTAIREGGKPLDLRWAMRNLARELGGLGGEHEGVVAAVIPGESAESLARQVHERLHRELRGGEIVVVASRPLAPATGSIQRQMRLTGQSALLLRRLGRTDAAATTDDLGLYAILFDTERSADLDSFLSHTVGTLADHDAAQGTTLVETVTAFFEQGTNAAQTARALYVHPNTVSKRLAKVESLLGRHWAAGESGLQLRVALQLLRLSRHEDPPPSTEA